MKFYDRAWPTVCNDQRHRIRVAAANMQEMNIEAFDVCYELVILIEAFLGLIPIVIISPVLAERLVIRERNSCVQSSTVSTSGQRADVSRFFRSFIADKGMSSLNGVT